MKPLLKNKKIFALLILVGGVAASFLIVNSDSSGGDNKLFSLAASALKNNQAFNFQRQSTEPLNPQVSENLDSDKNNLTNALIQNYIFEILKRNPEGPQLVNNKPMINAPSEIQLENLLEENLSRGLTITLYEKRDIKISNDNSPQSTKKYLEALKIATEKNFKDFKKTPFVALNDWLNQKRSDSLFEYITLTRNYISDLLEISAPPSWQTFHLQLINLQHKKAVVYESILNMDQDPLKALVATEQIEKIFQEDEDLATVLRNQLKNLSI